MFKESPLIRFMLVNKSLVANNFAPNAVVTLETVQGGGTVNDAFEQGRSGLTSLGATNLSETDGTVCGLPAQTVTSTLPAMPGMAPERPGKALIVADQAGDKMYVVTVTMQTTDPANPTYQHDSETILTGLQVLPPGATG
jgi:hypothetical protein